MYAGHSIAREFLNALIGLYSALGTIMDVYLLMGKCCRIWATEVDLKCLKGGLSNM